MWAEERRHVFEEFDDDWRAGAVLQGATARREPTLGTLCQRWATKEHQSVLPAMEASAVHERQAGTGRAVGDEAGAAVVPLSLQGRPRAGRRGAGPQTLSIPRRRPALASEGGRP